MSGYPHGLKPAADFTAEERAVIRERRKYQSAGELAAVFGTTWQCIAAICRMDRKDAHPTTTGQGAA